MPMEVSSSSAQAAQYAQAQAREVKPRKQPEAETPKQVEQPRQAEGSRGQNVDVKA